MDARGRPQPRHQRDPEGPGRKDGGASASSVKAYSIRLTKPHPQPKGTDAGNGVPAEWRGVAAAIDATREGSRPSPAPAPDLHHPDTPNKAEFDALYLSLCERPITLRETARRCWKAGFALGAVQAPAVADGARLDYIQRVGATVSICPGSPPDPWAIANIRFMVGGCLSSVNRDLRAAIDAALAASHPPVQTTGDVNG